MSIWDPWARLHSSYMGPGWDGVWWKSTYWLRRYLSLSISFYWHDRMRSSYRECEFGILKKPWIIKLHGLASYLFYQYHCLRVNRVYAEINTFLPPYSKRLFIAMIHRKVFNIKIVNIHFKWRKFLWNIRE